MESFPIIPWPAVPLLAAGIVLAAMSGRFTQRVAGGLALAAVLAAWGCELTNLTADAAPRLPIETTAVWGGLIYGLSVSLLCRHQPNDQTVYGPGWGRMLLSLSGVVCLSADSLSVVFVGLNLITIGLHWQLADGVATEKRERILAGFKFHQICLLMTLLGLIVLYGVCGTTSISEMATVLSVPGATVTAGGSALVAAVALLTGLCGFALSAVVSGSDSATPHRATAAMALTTVLSPAAALIVLIRLLPPVLPVVNNMVESAAITAAVIVLAVALWSTWASSRLASIMSGLLLLQFAGWLVGLAVGVWDSTHPDRSLTANSGIPAGISVSVFGLCADGLACLGLSGLLSVTCRGGRSMEFVDDLAGLLRRRPIAGCGAIICLASLCGLPPTPGFWFRWWSLIAAISPQHTSHLTGLYQPHFGFLLACGLLLAGWFATIYFSLRLLSAIMLDEPRGRFEFNRAWLAGLVIGTVCVAVLALGVQPGALLRFTMNVETRQTAQIGAPPGPVEPE